MGKPKQHGILRKILKAIGLSDEQVEEIFALIQSWLVGKKPAKLPPSLWDRDEDEGEVALPYELRDDFLSPAELNFYRVLRMLTADWAIVFTKVGLGDLFYSQTGDYGENISYRNKIDRKHVDFLLCDIETIRPILGIELDDRSHQRDDRKERDIFVNQVFEAAGLPLARIPVRHSYSTDQLKSLLLKKAALQSVTVPKESERNKPLSENAVICPNCGSEMVLRTARSGPNRGNKFWGCSAYPNCKGIVAYTV
ncbi:MAG: DUF2726 domain-containing protein [Candidatus Promineifilaceae bacterium]